MKLGTVINVAVGALTGFDDAVKARFGELTTQLRSENERADKAVRRADALQTLVEGHHANVAWLLTTLGIIENGFAIPDEWYITVVAYRNLAVKDRDAARASEENARKRIEELEAEVARLRELFTDKAQNKALRMPKYRRGEVPPRLEVGMVVTDLFIPDSAYRIDSVDIALAASAGHLFNRDRTGYDDHVVLAEDFYAPEPERKTVVYKDGTRPPVVRVGMVFKGTSLLRFEVVEINGDYVICNESWPGDYQSRTLPFVMSEHWTLAEDFEEVVT